MSRLYIRSQNQKRNTIGYIINEEEWKRKMSTKRKGWECINCDKMEVPCEECRLANRKCQICEDGETEFVCIECTKSLKAAEEDIRAGRLTKWIPLYDETKCKRVGDKHCKDHNDGYYCEYCIQVLTRDVSHS